MNADDMKNAAVKVEDEVITVTTPQGDAFVLTGDKHLIADALIKLAGKIRRGK